MPRHATFNKERPSYTITSVDHALRLASLLQMEGTTTVWDAADGEEEPDFHVLFARLDSVRQQRFALNNGLSERGVLAIGHPILDTDGVAVGVLSIPMPSSRFEPTAVRPMVRALRKATREVGAALRPADQPQL